MTTNGPLVQFAGNSIHFTSADPTILKTIATHFKHCTGAGAPVIAEYSITAAAPDVFSANVDGSDLFSDLDRAGALWQLMQDVLARLNGAATSHLIFHAAALASAGQAVILCGKSGSGKSSLAAWLTADGMQYMTDEVIAVPVQGEEICGLCRSLVLKANSAFIWQQRLQDTSSDGFLQFKDNSAWIEPTLLNPNGIQAAAVPRVLIFPRYESDTEFHLEPCTRAEALFHLMQNLVNARNFPDYGMGAAARLARKTTAFSLTYSNLEAASEWIRNRIAG